MAFVRIQFDANQLVRALPSDITFLTGPCVAKVIGS